MLQDISINVGDKIYNVTKQNFQLYLQPLLEIYDTQNVTLKRCVEDTLKKCSKSFLTKNNIEIFTKLCIKLGVTDITLNNTEYIDSFKKLLSQHIVNRNEFNILDIIKDSYKSNIIINDIASDPWYADTHCQRGHDRIGEGEVFLSFFSRGVKLKTGDVSFERVIPLKIELKGTSGRLLKSKEITITQNFVECFLQQPKTIHTMCVTLCVLSGVIDSVEGVYLFNTVNTHTLSIYSDVCNAITASNALHEYELLEKRMLSAWGKNTKKSSLRAICGAIQLALYKKEKNFDWLLLTKKETPYVCKGFQVSDNILANTLTIINNNILIQQNLDGKGYHISF
jgi:hypothetical protein